MLPCVDISVQALYQILLIRRQNDILDKENTGCRAMLRAQAEDGISLLVSSPLSGGNLCSCLPVTRVFVRTCHLLVNAFPFYLPRFRRIFDICIGCLFIFALQI